MNTLEELYNELGTLKWVGADEGWDKAIEAVRKYIKESIIGEEQLNAFGLDDKQIQDLYDELQKGITEEQSKFIPGPGIIDPVNWPEPVLDKSSFWEKCCICGKDKKYDYIGVDGLLCKHGHGGATVNTTDQKCLFDVISDWSDTPIMGLACSCPKCSPR